MLLGARLQALKAAALALIGNTAPVAFGSIATPIVTLAAQRTELPLDDLGSMVGRQTPFLALIVPLILVAVVDAGRLRQTWPAAMVAGVGIRRSRSRDAPTTSRSS